MLGPDPAGRALQRSPDSLDGFLRRGRKKTGEGKGQRNKRTGKGNSGKGRGKGGMRRGVGAIWEKVASWR